MDAPGYKHFVLAPIPGGSLTETKAVYEKIGRAQPYLIPYAF
jgi:hypothetical protein